ncbi:hypothetical protein ACVIJW_007557 [Bradyrhizobium barranii subsp. barranii]
MRLLSKSSELLSATSHPALIYVNITHSTFHPQVLAAMHLYRFAAKGRITMHRTKSLSIESATVAGIAASVLLGLGGLTLNPTPAKAVVYCQYVEYPVGCVARAGVVLRPRPVARAAVRHNAGGNANGGVNRVGVRR